MTFVSRVAGVVLTVGVIALAIQLSPGAEITTFVDAPSIVFVSAVIVGGLGLSFGFTPVCAAVARTARGDEDAGADRRALDLAIFDRGYRLAWNSGLIGSLVGTILMLSNLSDPAAIGPGLALALLTALYGGLIAEFVFRPLKDTQLAKAPAVSRQTRDPR